MTDAGSLYGAKPWLGLLDDVQRGPIDPDDSLVHALRRTAAEAPDRTFLAYFDGRLSHREVEDVLYTHPAVREAAVVGVPDGYRGETVKAYISLRPGTEGDPDAPAAYRKERLAAYKYPRQVEILPDSPKTATGKIPRRELRTRSEGSQ